MHRIKSLILMNSSKQVNITIKILSNTIDINHSLLEDSYTKSRFTRISDLLFQIITPEEKNIIWVLKKKNSFYILITI